MLQFNLIDYIALPKSAISYIAIGLLVSIVAFDVYFSKQYYIPKEDQLKFELFINKQNLLFTETQYQSSRLLKWSTHLENLIHAISAKLYIHKFVLKPNVLLLYGQTKNTKTFNSFWQTLKLDSCFKSIELIRWEQLLQGNALNIWSYVIQIGF